jgi:undecaprenyl diphosphate synthase
LQVTAFRNACVAFASAAYSCDVALLVVGDDLSPVFPDDLRQFVTRMGRGMKVNLLVNYDWEWDLAGLKTDGVIRSDLIPRMDLVIRWRGGRRLSGFLPVQSVYADIFVVDEYWPEFRPEHLQHAIEWFKDQDQSWADEIPHFERILGRRVLWQRPRGS